MNANFEELDYAKTPLGELILRRRRVLSIDQDIYEVKLDDSFLMSSLVNASEVALADRCLEKLSDQAIDVAVGGLGLGYTAQAVLANPYVQSLVVVEYLAEVIGWHNRRLVPAADSLVGNDRCRFVNGDFFALVQNTELGLDLESPGRKFDAILVDIDHTPDYFLDASHKGFYSLSGLRKLAAQMSDGGVFGLWSADEPDEAVLEKISQVFDTSEASVVEFRNPLMNIEDCNTIYIATGPAR